MKKVFKIILIALMAVLLIAAAAVPLFRFSLCARFVPKNLLGQAPDRILADIPADSSDPLQKQVTGGFIQGKNAETEGVQIYRGIPYAAPPVGELRWRSAQDVLPWAGVRDCTQNAPNPLQGDNETKPGEYGAETVPDPEAGYSEDCLYLNVWTNGTGENMPVVVYIPGGAWVGGGCSVENYDGEYLASQNVVFVSINYRLGILGWLGADALAEEDPEGSTGNYGLTDIIKALEWTRNNISSFGGNPENVTLYGGSAGGNLIDLLMASLKTEGLFQRAVSMSYPLDMISPAWDRNFKTDHGNKLVPDSAALEKLRALSNAELMRNTDAIAAYAFSGPTIDGVYIDMKFADALAQGRGKNIDYICGINYSDDCPEHNGEATGDGAFVSMIADPPEGASDGDVLRTILNSVALARSNGGAENTYLVQFTHHTPGPEKLGAVHGGDLQYMLHYFSDNRKDYWTETDYRMGEMASAYFINFCRTGDPNGLTAGGEALPEWVCSKGDDLYFEMGDDCGMRTMQNTALTAEYLAEEKGYEFLK